MVSSMACTTMTTVITKVRPKTVHISMCRQAPRGLPLLNPFPGLSSTLLMGGIVTPAERETTQGGGIFALARRITSISPQVGKEDATLRRTDHRRRTQPLRKSAALVGLTLLALLCGCAGSYRQPIQLVHEVGPVYPEQAKAAGVQGWVRVYYDIGEDGAVENLILIESDPPGVFDAAALAAVAQWRYRPPVADGAPSRVNGVVSILRFELDGAERYEGY